MNKKLLLLTALVTALTFALMAADVTGKWTWEQAGRQGGNPTVQTLALKADGATLTGTMSGGRGGDVAITDGKVDGAKVSFTVKRTMGDNEFVISYKGTLDGETLNLEVTRPGMGGGDPVTTKVAAKRATT